MKKNVPVIAIGCVLFLGVCVLLYPAVSALLARMKQAEVISAYRSTVRSMTDTQIEKLKTDARKYNETLSGASLSDPFSGGNKHESSSLKMLNVGEVIGYLEIPKINVYLPIYHGTSEEILQKGVGHLENTSLPVGGAGTHSVLSGHRGLPSETLFTDLDQLAKGDKFYLHVLDEVLAYQVDQIKVVNPQDTSDLTIQKGKDYVTLVTCTPYGINTQRLLIRGVRTVYEGGEKEAGPVPILRNEVAQLPVGFLLLIVLPFVLFFWWRRKKKGARL